MRKQAMFRILGAILAACCLASTASADVKLPAIFGDHMVLQQDMSLPVWGWADKGEQVTVTIADQSKTVTADDEGKWTIKLDALKPGQTYALKVQGKNSVEFSDVLVGEVWLCSGQSNMQMTVGASGNSKAEIAAANYSAIRMFTVARKTAETPQNDCKGKWSVCSPKTVAGFSAAGYFFGREPAQTVARAGRADRFVLGRHGYSSLDQCGDSRKEPRVGPAYFTAGQGHCQLRSASRQRAIPEGTGQVAGRPYRGQG